MSNDIDMFDILKIINRRKGKFLALLISDVAEEFEANGFIATRSVLSENDEFYLHIRKLIFDYINDYTRSVSRIFLGGDVE